MDEGVKRYLNDAANGLLVALRMGQIEMSIIDANGDFVADAVISSIDFERETATIVLKVQTANDSIEMQKREADNA
jgi:succinyl-CoA synthetase alpha subunit